MKESSPQAAIKEGLVCYHCGEDCKEKKVVLAEKVFCCNGCKLVYEILEENNLCTYYSIEASKGNSPDTSQFDGKFSYLDDAYVLSRLIHFSEENQNHVTFFIPGIHCSSCIWLLEHLQKMDSSILSSSVNFPKRELTVIYRPDKIKLSRVAEIITSIGYEPHINLNDIDNEKSKKIDRSLWYKIGVAGFCFGNIMMLSFPEYFSIADVDEQPGLRLTFSLLNLGLAIPVLFFSASDFFKSAIGALKARQLNIDLPVAAAILMTFLRSVYELALGIGPGYFDSMAGIVFFMLIGRAFQNKTYETLAFDRDYKSYFPVAVSVASSEGETRVPVTALKRGMRMIIRNAEIIPADSILLKGEAMIDYSFVTGESAPVKRKSGDLIYAGGKQTGQSIELEIVKPVKQSYLTALWNKPAFQKDDAQENRASLENRINKYFTISVFIISIVSASYWLWQGETQRMINAVTTILIVACPCILLLAASFTQGNVLRILGRNGFFLRNAFVIEKLSKSQVIVFDKTGTLTSSVDRHVSFSGTISDEDLKAAVSICKHSNHPLSRAIVEQYDLSDLLEISSFEEVSGQGIRATLSDKRFLLGSPVFTGITETDSSVNRTRVYLKKDDCIVGYFQISHSMRVGMNDLLKNLKKKNEIYLLSGDNDSDRLFMSEWFSDDHMLFNQKPEQKLEFIQTLKTSGKNVIMIGDGLNDAGALQQSDAGIAVSDDLNNFSPACDAIIDGKLLPSLDILLDYSRDSKKVILVSFALSTIYNVIGLYFAIQGELQPVIAAILMPTASISIVSFATLSSSFLAKLKRL
ncbi:MAG: heavy metal translocating P-type ATPase metal-binding domain-containing protein [Bacteroidia bacterium]